MRALGYFSRVDALTQASEEAGSAVDFERDFLEYCDINLHQAVKIFGDVETSEDGQRTQYEELLTFIRSSGSNFLVAIPDASHLGGDLESVARAFLEVEGAGAKVACQDPDMPDPLQSAFAVLGVTGVSRERSDKIRASMQNRAIDGKALGRPPYGYRNGDDGKLVVVKDEARVVELIFRLYTVERLGMRRIVQRLNERGITTRRGGNWNLVSVRDILKNAVYIGTYAKFGLRLSGSHDAIIAPETYRAARDMVRERRPRPRPSRAEPFLLSGIAFCDYCGNKMMGVTRHQQWRNKDGNRNRKTYRYYQCQSRNNQSVCGYHTWREAELEDAVLARIRQDVKAGGRRQQRRGGQDERSDEAIRRIWEERKRNAERRFLQAMRKTASGAADTDLLQQAVADLDRARGGAERPGPSAGVGQILRRWDKLGFEDRRDFLLTHVSRVEVSDQVARVVV